MEHSAAVGRTGGLGARRRRLLLALATLTLGVLTTVVLETAVLESAVFDSLAPPEVGAQEAEGVTLGPVTCGGNLPLEVGVRVDCLATTSRDLPAGASVVAIDPAGTQTVCRAANEELLCPDVGRGLVESGTHEVQFYLDDPAEPTVGQLATSSFQTVEPTSTSITFDRSEPVVFAGHPLRVLLTDAQASPGDEIPDLFLVVRERRGEEVVAVVDLEPTAGEQEFDLDVPVGRYRVWPCVGFYAETCTERSGGHPVQVISTDTVPLLPGHNRASAERINIVFVASGFDESNLPEVARAVLGWTGPVNTGDDLLYGPMAIEPLRSARDRLNFWLLPVEIADEQALLADSTQAHRLEDFDLPNLQITTLYAAAGPSDARTTSFYGRYEVPERSRISFGGVRVSLDPENPAVSGPTLAHEWGHGLFDLRDEYDAYDEREALTRYPNCAPDEATATSWWGEDLGRVDPFVYDIIEAREDAGLSLDVYDQPLAELVRIDLVPGGCLGDEGIIEGFRPSVDSLMNSELPVFGTVNRTRAEEVLSQFSGRGPVEKTEDLVVSCVSKAERMTCEGRLRSHLDPPEAGIDIGGAGCEFDAEREPVAVVCTGTAPADEYVTVSIGLERGRVRVVNVDPPPTDPTLTVGPTSDSPSPSDPDERQQALAGAGTNDGPTSSGSLSRFWTIVFASFGVAGLLVFLGRRRS